MEPVPYQASLNPTEHVHTGAHQFEQVWLTVEQAVVFCAELGLTRTPKTVRKWAERSSGAADGDVLSRKEDTPWGYRWQIEKSSLTRKVEEELELRSASATEQVRTGALELNARAPEKTLLSNEGVQPNQPEPVHTGADAFALSETETDQENNPEQSAHPFAPVQTRSEIELVLDEVRERLSDKDQEIAFLRDQLADAQAEIGKRAASTDEALKTIDRVVRSFELQAEANRAAVLEARKSSTPEYSPTYTRSDGVDNATGRQDIRRV